MTPADLKDFTAEVSRRFDAGEIPGPIHLNSDSQIEPLMAIFEDIGARDWVLSTWRSTYHALLCGVPRELVMAEIIAGRSMQLHFPEYRFMTSSIMGGMLPIACGLAAGGERVWCFVGDMCASTGAFRDAWQYAYGHNLGAIFVVENNGLSTNTPTEKTWGHGIMANRRNYNYKRTTPHYGTRSGSGF